MCFSTWQIHLIYCVVDTNLQLSVCLIHKCTHLYTTVYCRLKGITTFWGCKFFKSHFIQDKSLIIWHLKQEIGFFTGVLKEDLLRDIFFCHQVCKFHIQYLSYLFLFLLHSRPLCCSFLLNFLIKIFQHWNQSLSDHKMETQRDNNHNIIG